MDKQPHSGTELMITLGSDLRIGRAGEVFTTLESAANAAGVVVIDGADVSKIDAAGLQALTVAIVAFRAAGTTWRWHNGSAALTSAAKMLGLEGTLGLQ